MTLHGKGFFIWKINDCERGDPQAIATAANAAGFTHILIKIADGSNAFNIDSTTRIDLLPPVVEALRARGVQVWGWHYVYGYEPLAEARVAVRRTQQLNLDGYVIDAEIQYKEPGRAVAARQYMQELRRGLPNLPIALSSYRFPTYHPQLPWREFLEQCDFNMPQVYWEKAHNPGAQLRRCISEFQVMNPYRPVIPTGPAYKWDGWRPTLEDMTEFLDTAAELKLPAVNFFSWDECRRDLQSHWDLIDRHHYGEPAPEPPKDMPVQLIQAMNSHSPERVAALYRQDAVQVNAFRTVQGQRSIRSWYEYFFTSQAPKAVFTLTGSTGSGNTRHFTWSAVGPGGHSTRGSDTIGLLDGKIIYHYTSFLMNSHQ